MGAANPHFLLAAFLLVSIPAQLYAKFDSHAPAESDGVFFTKSVHPESRQGKPMLLPEMKDMKLLRVSTGSVTRSAGEDSFHPPTVGQYLVRVTTPVRKDLAKDLRRITQGSVRYIQHHTFLVDIPNSALSAVMAVDGVVEVFVHPSTLKIDLSLKTEAQAEQSRRRNADAGDSEDVVIGALLLPGRVDRDPNQMAALWESTLKHHGIVTKAVVETANAINVHTKKQQLGEVAEWLATQDHVERVIWNSAGQTQDYYYAQAIQGGRQGYTGTPAWNKGIQGQGQIITVSDTGINEQHCVFYDSNTVAKCSGSVGYQSSCFNTDHRKIVSIQLSGRFNSVGTNFYDQGSGHGTQCASLAAGSILGDNTYFLTGIAPASKLLILDCNHDQQDMALWFPSDWPTWWEHSYGGGSRVHSASWVVASSNADKIARTNAYNSWTRDADQFIYNHPDYVATFAAGNSGEEGYLTVQEPSSAKNVLSVGMTKSASETYEKQCEYSSGGCVLGGHYLWVDRAQWMALDYEAENNQREITDYEYWSDAKNGQFFSFYDWFRSCNDLSNKRLCGGKQRAKFFGDTNQNRIELRKEDWGGSLGDNEIVNTRIVAPTNHPCGCDLQAGEYTTNEVLILHWDWHKGGLAFSMCNPDKVLYKYMKNQEGFFPNTYGQCTKETAWAAIQNSGAKAVVLIGEAEERFTNDLQSPTNGGNTGPAVYQVQNDFGQILFAAVAKDFFLKRMAFYQTDLGPHINDVYDSYYNGATPYEDYEFYLMKAPGNSARDTATFVDDFNYVDTGAWSSASLDIQLESVTHSVWRSLTSRGPTYDLRFKPDIVCAGEVPYSAQSDDMDTSNGGNLEHCPANHLASDGWMATAGTSMATPSCAGGVALIQQYFKEGWHLAGVQNVESGIIPSAALVKAMVINSGQPVWVDAAVSGSQKGYIKPMEGYPNYFTGFGFMSLGRVLMFDDSDFTLLIEDRANAATGALNTGDAYETCFAVAAGDVPLVVSLAWTDAVGAANAGRLLVNNLDLVLVSPSGNFFYGNHLTHSEYGSVPDYLNNLERVTVDAPVEAGSWSIRVIGVDVPDGPQGFALVGTGNIAASDLNSCASLPECENSCSGQGTCTEGRCECDVGYAGADCSVEIVQLVDGVVTGANTVQPIRTTYFWLDLSTHDSADLSVTVTVSSGMVDVQITDCGYPGMDDVRMSHFKLESSVTLSTSGACGKWVIAVTGNTDPRVLTTTSSAFAVEDSLPGSVFTVKATSSNQAGTSSSCQIPAASCPGAVNEPADPFPLSILPNENYASCTLSDTWQEITALQVADISQVKTGGLGSRIVLGQYEVWLCLVNHSCSTSGDPICFVYDEIDEVFKVWGKNSELEIF